MIVLYSSVIEKSFMSYLHAKKSGMRATQPMATKSFQDCSRWRIKPSYNLASQGGRAETYVPEDLLQAVWELWDSGHICEGHQEI